VVEQPLGQKSKVVSFEPPNGSRNSDSTHTERERVRERKRGGPCVRRERKKERERGERHSRDEQEAREKGIKIYSKNQPSDAWKKKYITKKCL